MLLLWFVGSEKVGMLFTNANFAFVYLGFVSFAQGYCREKDLRLEAGLDVLFKREASLE
jgi:hypothetical protein